MKPQYSNYFAASFSLWLDHTICYFGDAYTNFSGQLFPTTDPWFSDYNIFGCAFRQWVADSSITGATIPSGIYNGSTFIPRGISGLNIDYGNAEGENGGRVISDIIPSGTTTLSAAYAVKDFNIYYTNIDEAYLLFDLAPTLPDQSQLGLANTGALFYNQQPYPSIYFKTEDGENDPFAFGGLRTTITEVRCIILSNDDWKLDGALSIMRDTAQTYFPLLSGSQLPFNVFGDTTGYNYLTLCQNSQQNQLAYIRSVKTMKFDERINRKIGPQVGGAIATFEIKQIRQPRVNSYQ